MMPSLTSTSNQIIACVHRFGRNMPDPDPATILDFERYCRRFIVEEFEPITTLDLPSFDVWLEHTPYSNARKKQLRELRKTMSLDDKAFDSQSFGKWEQYPKYKAMRAINSPSDLSKAILGPLIWASDKKTFKSRFFVKGSDPKTWPDQLRKLFGTQRVVETDFTAFESTHRDKFAEIISFWLDHMTQLVRTDLQWQYIQHLVNGTNRAVFKFVTATIPQRLMSGSLWTSSANGVLNLMIMSYLSGRAQYPNLDPERLADIMRQEFVGKVEGDDGITLDVGITPLQIANLGIVLDFEPHDNYSQANFCGITCPLDGGSIIIDPMKVMRKFFLIPPKYMNSPAKVHLELLRAKALSYAHLFGECPIVGALSRAVLRLTSNVRISRSILEYYTDEVRHNWLKSHTMQGPNFLHAQCKPAGLKEMSCSNATRTLFAERFYFSIPHQMRIERAFDAWEGGSIWLELPFTLEEYDYGLSHLSAENKPAAPLDHKHPAVDAFYENQMRVYAREQAIFDC